MEGRGRAPFNYDYELYTRVILYRNANTKREDFIFKRTQEDDKLNIRVIKGRALTSTWRFIYNQRGRRRRTKDGKCLLDKVTEYVTSSSSSA